MYLIRFLLLFMARFGEKLIKSNIFETDILKKLIFIFDHFKDVELRIKILLQTILLKFIIDLVDLILRII